MKDVKLSPTLMAGLAIFSAGLGGGWLLNPAARHESHEPVAAADSAEAPSPAAEPTMASTVASETQPPDFAERLQRALAISRHVKRDRAIAGLVDVLDASQIREALAATAKLRGPTGDAIRADLLSRWGALDHEPALKYALASGDEIYLTLRQVIAGWAETDEPAAESWAKNQDPEPQETAWWALTEVAGEVDPEKALLLAAKITFEGEDNGALAKAIFGKWAQSAPRAAAARAEQLEGSELRDAALALVARKWAEVDVQAALAWAESLPDREPGQDDSSEESPSKLALLEKVLAVWSDRDPAAAVAWLKQMPDPDRRLEFCRSVIASMTESDPEQAAQLLPRLLPADTVEDEDWTKLVSAWCQINPASALAWVNAQTDPQLRKFCADQLVESTSGWGMYPPPIDAQTASTLLNMAAALDDEEQKRECIESMLSAWAFDNPKAATEWLAARPPNASEWYSLASAWMKPDPTDAIAWVNHLPEGKEKQKLLLNLAADLDLDSPGNPEALANWISQITDAGTRQTAFEYFANRWLDLDYVAALKWLPAAPLPDDVKQKLRQPYAR